MLTVSSCTHWPPAYPVAPSLSPVPRAPARPAHVGRAFFCRKPGVVVHATSLVFLPGFETATDGNTRCHVMP